MNKNIYILIILVTSFHMWGCGSGIKRRSDTIKSDTVPSRAKMKVIRTSLDTAGYVREIQEYADSIERKLSELSEIKTAVFGSSAEGGEISVYRSGADTLKLKAVYYGEMGKNEYKLYLRNKKLVLFKERAVAYRSPIGEKSVRIDKETTSVFVLNGEDVVLGREGLVFVSKAQYVTKSGDIQDLYKEIKHQLHE